MYSGTHINTSTATHGSRVLIHVADENLCEARRHADTSNKLYGGFTWVIHQIITKINNLVQPIHLTKRLTNICVPNRQWHFYVCYKTHPSLIVMCVLTPAPVLSPALMSPHPAPLPHPLLTNSFDSGRRLRDGRRKNILYRLSCTE